MSDEEQVPWEIQYTEATWKFAKECRALSDKNPYGNYVDPLGDIITYLMTELWDNYFSQTEIRSAFERVLEQMPRYAAGEDRRDDSRRSGEP